MTASPSLVHFWEESGDGADARDDYPIHQTAEPVAYAGTDRNFYDRYFFNGYSPPGTDDGFFAAALGVYPHLNVIDASFCWLSNGRQANLHASRGLNMERMDTQVGPIGVEVIEPLKSLRITVDAPTRAFAPAHLHRPRLPAGGAALHPPQRAARADGRDAADAERPVRRLDQVDGVRTDCAGWVGTRDRSWGVRPIGARDEQPASPAIDPQFFWLWSPCVMEGGDLYFHTNDDAHGRFWNRRAAWRAEGAGPEDERHRTMRSRRSTRSRARATRRRRRSRWRARTARRRSSSTSATIS
ncbi:hypothetical protein AB5I41_19215 [Sphingomonas sp. MMS24-JH45]